MSANLQPSKKKKEAYLQFKCKSHVIVEYLPVLPTVINIFYVSESSKLREINFGKLLFYSWQDCNLLYLSYFDVIGIWKFYVNTYFQGMISVIFWNQVTQMATFHSMIDAQLQQMLYLFQRKILVLDRATRISII